MGQHEYNVCSDSRIKHVLCGESSHSAALLSNCPDRTPAAVVPQLPKSWLMRVKVPHTGTELSSLTGLFIHSGPKQFSQQLNHKLRGVWSPAQPQISQSMSSLSHHASTRTVAGPAIQIPRWQSSPTLHIPLHYVMLWRSVLSKVSTTSLTS